MQLWPVQPPDPSPFEMAAAGELQRRVEVALATLPAVYREAMLLVAQEGFTPSEAAVICRITPVAMRQRLRRARALLAERLEQQHDLAVPITTEAFP